MSDVAVPVNEDAFELVDSTELGASIINDIDNGMFEEDTANVVKISVQFNSNVIAFTIPRSGTAEDLLAKIRQSSQGMPRDFLDSIELWEVSASAVARCLKPEDTVGEQRLVGNRIYVVARGRRLFIIHFEDGRFVPVVFPTTATAQQVLEPDPELSDLCEMVCRIRNPRLCVSEGASERDLNFEDVLNDSLPIGSSFQLTIRSAVPLGGLGGLDSLGMGMSTNFGQDENVVVRNSRKGSSGSGDSTPGSNRHSSGFWRGGRLSSFFGSFKDGGAHVNTNNKDAPSSSAGDLKELTLRSWLLKKGDLINHNWQKRFCVFSDGLLKYYSSASETEPNGIIKLADMTGVDIVADDVHKYPNVFLLYTSLNERTFYFSAETPDLRDDWISVLQSALELYRQEEKRKPRLCGYMEKKGYYNPSWKRRWFVLYDTVLEYADGPEKHASRTNVTGIPLADVNATSAEGLNIVLVGLKGDRTYYLRAETMNDKEDWLG